MTLAMVAARIAAGAETSAARKSRRKGPPTKTSGPSLGGKHLKRASGHDASRYRCGACGAQCLT
jgi:hypothetical protein